MQTEKSLTRQWGIQMLGHYGPLLAEATRNAIYTV